MADHRQLGGPMKPSGLGSLSGLAFGMLDGRPVAVVVDSDLRVLDLAERRHIRQAAVGRLFICDVACTQLNGLLVAVTGGYDRTVRVLDVATGKQLGEPLCGHTSVIRAVACGVLGGRPMAVTAGEDETVRVWDLERHEQVGPPRIGHTGHIWAVACGTLDGRPIAVSGSRDCTLRLWHLDDPDHPGTALAGHDKGVDAVALTAVAGREVAVSGGEDVRVWDLRTHRQIGAPLFDGRDIGWIHAVACGTLHGRPLALALSHGERVRVWDLEEHRRISADVPARYATTLPSSWTDPDTGDIYDLTRKLVDAAGDRWEIVDYDGFEPIVVQHPVNLRVTLGIADAHARYDFAAVVTPGPPRPAPQRVTHSTLRQYYDFRVIDEDRTLSPKRVKQLSRLYPQAKVTPNRMVWDFDPDDDGDDPGPLLSEWEELLCSSFDAFLEFQAGGARDLVFRLPAGQLTQEALAPYLTDERHWEGLSVRVRDGSMLIHFTHYEVDGELTHWRAQPGAWLKPLLPLRAELAGGDLSAAYLGWLKGAEEAPDRDQRPVPPRPATLRKMTPQLKKLATLLDLDQWARKHLP